MVESYNTSSDIWYLKNFEAPEVVADSNMKHTP